jgi:hypothetical protein
MTTPRAEEKIRKAKVYIHEALARWPTIESEKGRKGQERAIRKVMSENNIAASDIPNESLLPNDSTNFADNELLKKLRAPSPPLTEQQKRRITFSQQRASAANEAMSRIYEERREQEQIERNYTQRAATPDGLELAWFLPQNPVPNDVIERIRHYHQQAQYAERGHARCRHEWGQATFGLGKALLEAREKCPANQDFGHWLKDNDIKLGKNDRAALINLAENIAITEDVILEADTWSWQILWIDHVQPRALGRRIRNPRGARENLKKR